MGTRPSARQFSGRMMVIVGFVMLVLNAADYLFSWNQFGPWFVAVGLIFVATGAGLARSAGEPERRGSAVCGDGARL